MLKVGGFAQHLERFRRWLDEPEDAAGLAAFRALFGLLMLIAVVRFWSLGWIEELYVAPDYHFTYWGFDWVVPWPGWGMYAHFIVMGLTAVGIAVGWRSRWCALAFFLLFTYAELIDKSAYLNHYYLVSLLALLLAVVPAGAGLSMDARRRGCQELVPRWSYWLLRGQMSIVYFYAGFAKLNPDWLWRAEPLGLWLSTFTDTPLLGPLLGQHFVAYAMSWAGMLYDLSIAPLLLWRRTRRGAFLVAVFFHVSVWWLFPIGIFPWVMLLGATLFFDPAWPRRVIGGGRSFFRAATAKPSAWRDNVSVKTPSWLIWGCGVYLAVQVLVPLRFLLYPGWVNWTEQGFRFAWRVMLIEKAGQVEFDVVLPAAGQRLKEYPRRTLSKLQYRMLSTQPDMIHQYALHLAERYRQQGHQRVQVYADAWVSLNGRESQRIIDARVDLAAEPRSLAASRFILPLD